MCQEKLFGDMRIESNNPFKDYMSDLYWIGELLCKIPVYLKVFYHTPVTIISFNHFDSIRKSNK